MHKRGQVTIFLIVGILLLAIFAGILYLTSTIQKERLELEEESPLTLKLKQPLTSFVESCLRQTAVPGIYLLGLQGGIIYPDDPTTILLTENALINYGYLKGVDQLSVEAMEQQLNRYVEENLFLCLDDFLRFAEEGIFITEKKPVKSDVKIRPDETVLQIKYQLEVRLGDDSFRMDSFSTNVPLRVGSTLREAKAIIRTHEENPAHLLPPEPAEQSYFISSFPFDAFTFIYSISDQNSIIDGAPFTFMFAIRDDAINTAPELTYIPNMVVRRGEPLNYQLTALDAEEDILTFSSNSALFPVDSEGVVTGTTTTRGTYMVTFTVADIQGLKDEQEVRIVVKDEE